MNSLDLAKLEKDGEGVTRDGRQVIIYSTKADGEKLIHGCIKGFRNPSSWTKLGSYYNYESKISSHDLLNKPDANEGKESEAVKADNFQVAGGLIPLWNPSTKTATAPSESCEQSETFDWKTAMALFSQGENVQYEHDGWKTISHERNEVFFSKYYYYRRKPLEPSPATPDKKEEESPLSEGTKAQLQDARLGLLEAKMDNIQDALRMRGIL